MGPDGPTVAKFIGDFIKKELDNYLHKDKDVAEVILRKVQESEKERKSMAGITKLARERAKKVNLHNRKLLDCRVHLNDTKGDELKRKPRRYSSPRATRPPDQSPRYATWRPRQCSRSRASRSIPTV